MCAGRLAAKNHRRNAVTFAQKWRPEEAARRSLRYQWEPCTPLPVKYYSHIEKTPFFLYLCMMNACASQIFWSISSPFIRDPSGLLLNLNGSYKVSVVAWRLVPRRYLLFSSLVHTGVMLLSDSIWHFNGLSPRFLILLGIKRPHVLLWKLWSTASGDVRKLLFILCIFMDNHIHNFISL